MCICVCVRRLQLHTCRYSLHTHTHAHCIPYISLYSHDHLVLIFRDNTELQHGWPNISRVRSCTSPLAVNVLTYHPPSCPTLFSFVLSVGAWYVCSALEHIPLAPYSTLTLRSVPRAVITSTKRASSLSLLVHNQGITEDGVLIPFPGPLGIAILCLLLWLDRCNGVHDNSS